MGNIATLRQGTSLLGVSFSDKQLKIIKDSVAPGLTSDEFDLFIEQCRAYALNPVRKQIYAVPYNTRVKENGQWVAKRSITLIVGIEGLRSIAHRTGNYRPDEEPAVLDFDEAAKGAENPLGIIKATARIFIYRHGEWFPVKDEAYWDEYAQTFFDKDEKVNKAKGQWAKMGRIMIAKCAEAKALRKAFPEDIGALYEAAEMDHMEGMRADLSPSEAVAEQERVEREQRISHEQIIPVTWSRLGSQEAVPVSKLEGRLIDFYRASDASVELINWFTTANQESLKMFWARKPDEALECKRIKELRLEELASVQDAEIVG